MLKLNASYSKKLPAEAEFSSRSYHASIEQELPDGLSPEQLRGRIHDTFALVRDAVDRELNGSAGSREAPPGPSAREPSREAAPRASNRQIKFLTDLATRQGLSLADLNADIRRRFGIDGLYDLDKKQASRLLDELNGRKAA